MKKLLKAVFLSIITIFLFVGCAKENKKVNTAIIYGANKNEIAFGETYGSSLGYIKGKTDSDGNLTLLVIDEIFMPIDWAEVNLSEAQAVNVETVNVGSKFYAKYIYIADILYTGNTDGENIIYLDSSGANLQPFYSDYILAKKYYDAVTEFMEKRDDTQIAFGGGTNGKIKIGISIGFKQGKIAMAAGKTTGAGISFFKRESGYLSNRNGLGLHQNYDAMEEFLRQYGLDVDLSKIPDEINGSWTVGDVTTGATISDFKKYMYIAKLLYDKIK